MSHLNYYNSGLTHSIVSIKILFFSAFSNLYNFIKAINIERIYSKAIV